MTTIHVESLCPMFGFFLITYDGVDFWNKALGHNLKFSCTKLTKGALKKSPKSHTTNPKT